MKKRIIQLGVCLLIGGIIATGLGYINGGHNQIFLGRNGKITLAEERESVLYVDEPLVFTSIDVQTDVMDLVIVPAEAFSIEAKYNKIDPIEYSVEDGVLTIVAKRKTSIINIGMTFGEENRMVVSVPKDLILDQLTVGGNVGSITIGALSTKNANITSNVGELLVNGLTADALKANTSTGDIDIRDADIERCTVHSNVGGIYMRPVGKRGDYTIHLSTNVGSRRIVGENSDDKNDGNRQIDATSNVGDISVEF